MRNLNAFVEAIAKAHHKYVSLEKTGEPTYYFGINKNKPELKEELDRARVHRHL